MPSRTDPPAALLPSLPVGARVLVIRLRSLGDTLLLTPSLRALKQWRPDLRLSVLLYQRFAPVLDGNPDVEEVLALDPEGPTAVLELARAVADLRERQFAACFNLHGGTLSAVLTLASGAPHRLGLARHRFAFAYTGRAPDPRVFLGKQRLHTVEVQISLFYWAGLPQGEIPPLQVFSQPEARAAVAKMLDTRAVGREARYAVLHPVANFLTKEWPFDRYAALAQWLEEEGLVPVFIAGPGEGAKLDAVEDASPRPLRRLESLTIPELVALIEGSSLFVGNDSGPAHIAAALNRPLVVLFGSSDSAAWGPWPHTGGKHRIVQNEYACNPCRGDRCYAFDKPECILSLTQEQVRAAVRALRAPAAEEHMAMPTWFGSAHHKRAR